MKIIVKTISTATSILFFTVFKFSLCAVQGFIVGVLLQLFVGDLISTGLTTILHTEISPTMLPTIFTTISVIAGFIPTTANSIENKQQGD